ncbi:MAG TPA: OadG family protein, partial [Methanofastidiosum sp.]|nr:OadG family protein [Methanofastidiosum sp.]
LVLVGMAITFLVLIILSGVINYFGVLIKRMEEKNSKVEEKDDPAEIVEEIKASNDHELTAMISAAYFHISKDAISLINLHSKQENWKLIGRRDQMEVL